MAFCPKCREQVSLDAAECPWCYASFTGGGLKPLVAPPPPPIPVAPSRGMRIFLASVKVGIVLMSLAWLSLGYVSASSVYASGHPNAPLWAYANAGAAVLVVVIALFAKTPWSALAMLASIAFGFTSCAANFELNMR